MLEIFVFKKNRNCSDLVAKTKALISCAVTAQLIRAFVFAYAKFWFSHDAAHVVRNFFLICSNIYCMASR